MPASSSARLHGWIARASLPEERLRCAAFAAADEQDAVVVGDRCASWEALFAGDGEAESTVKLARLKTRLLRARGVAESEWRLGMRDVVVCAADELPAWAVVFIELYRCWQATPSLAATAAAPAGKPYLLLTAVWAAQRRAWVESKRAELKTAGIILTDTAVDDLLEYLNLRLATPVFSVLRAWPKPWPADAANDGGDRWRFLRRLTFWQTAFDRQPILTHIIGHLTQLWQAATAEMLSRFKTDLPRLRDAELLRAGDTVTVLRLRCGLGDPHRGGRSVAIVETDCGDVVYKPKDLAGTRATGRLLRELHEADAMCAPLAPAFLYRRGYGWEQCVRARECESVREVETFYRRLGGWLFLLQLLNGNDFWYDNLIACADMPFFIDYETVVGNNLTLPFADRRAPLDASVARFYQMQMVGILPLQMPGAVDGSLADGIDISVATRPGKQAIPFPTSGAFGGFHDDFEASDYAPFYRGEFQDMNEHFARFIDGYRRMAARIESPAGRAALQNFRRRIRRARFRHIVIDTWSCYALLGSLFGESGADGARAAIALDAVCARFSHYPSCVVDGLRRDLWRNDVPLFELQADGLRLFNAAGEATDDFFADSALTIIARNRVYLRDNLTAQVARIKALFSTRPDNPRRRWRDGDGDSDGDSDGEGDGDGDGVDAVDASATITTADCLAVAWQIGAKLAADLNRADKLQNCLAIGRAQRNNIRALQPLPADYHGAAGAVVFLARLRHDVDSHPKAKVADDGDVADAIDTALSRCGRHLLGAPRMAFLQRGVVTSGALSLFGGKLLALCRLARAGVDAGFDTAAAVDKLMNAHLDDLNAATLLYADERHGVSGLLARLPELALLHSANTVTAWLARILDIIESKALQFCPPQTESYKRYADAFWPAHNTAVERVMQSHWRNFTSHAGYRKLQRMNAEHAPATIDNTIDTTEALRDMRSEALLDRAYRLLARAHRDDGDGGVHRDGDGDSGDGGAHRDSGDDGDGNNARAQLHRHLAELIARRRATGRCFADRWADDEFTPGAVYGAADLGLLLLSANARANLNPFRMPTGD